MANKIFIILWDLQVKYLIQNSIFILLKNKKNIIEIICILVSTNKNIFLKN